MIFVKRTFHPVGQGAFFTEQFFDEKLETVLYNVVYDCGSLNLELKKQVKIDIENCFHDRKIDVLFLSHFDKDHINYVDHLKEKGYLHGTRIFIPMLSAEEWYEIKNYNSVLSLNEDTSEGRKVIKVKTDGERGNDFLNDPVDIDDIRDDSIESGTPLMPKNALQGVIWYYTPFNVQSEALITEFKEKLEEEGIDTDLLEDVDTVLELKDNLKEYYQGLGKRPSEGTKINLNSLLVMSYPKNSEACELVGFGQMYNHFVYYGCGIGGRYYNGSCLYTGDTSANEDFVWNRIEQMIARCLGKDKVLILLQIPHHGSRHSYDQKLLDSNKFLVGFTNYDPFYHKRIFDETLPMKFAVRDKPLILVTTEYVSRFEEYWKVG